MKKPRIGLICFVFQSISVRNYMIQKGYVKGIIDAGGIPVLIAVYRKIYRKYQAE